MQKLKFEAAWDKTLSQKDREEIEEIFSKSIPQLKEDIEFTTVWIAENYKEELLVTALVHNRTKKSLTFEQTTVQFVDGNSVLGEHTFTIPALHIESETSMPWTFIFPSERFDIPDSIENGTLKIK